MLQAIEDNDKADGDSDDEEEIEDDVEEEVLWMTMNGSN